MSVGGIYTLPEAPHLGFECLSWTHWARNSSLKMAKWQATLYILGLAGKKKKMKYQMDKEMAGQINWTGFLALSSPLTN